MQLRRKDKVFCLSFQKSGTTTIKKCLERLGYKVAGPNFIHDKITDRVFFNKASQVIDKYDAFQDNPWPLYYRFLDTKFPDAKFILTERDADAWLNSMMAHFSGKWSPLRQRIYGVGDPAISPELFRQRYIRHNQNVKSYFSGRENKLLVLPLDDSFGWQPLCDFLHLPVPDGSVPHANSKDERQKYQSSFRGKAASLVHRFRFNRL
jgi:sulfotransferase family protein